MNEIDEPLARFVAQSGKMKLSEVKPSLFTPNRHSVVSVFRIKGLGFPEITEIGTGVVAQHPTSKRLYGWGKLPSSAVREVGLKLVNDDNPPRHSSIEGWPRKSSARLALQSQLARKTELVRLDKPVEVKRFVSHQQS